jgi:predicted  nucleic acid-binding Zn-ribbon protein
MERPKPTHETVVLRCLDCGTVYSQPERDLEGRGCPNCGYVGWIVAKAPERPKEKNS